jgi:hypothetical protein
MAASERRRAVAQEEAQAKADWQRASSRIGEQLARAAQLERELAELKAAIAANQEVEVDLREQHVAALQALAAMPDISVQLVEAQGRLRRAEQESQAQRRRRTATEQVERLRKESAEARLRHDQADQVLHQLRELRRHLLDDLDLGVEGLQIGDGELLSNGMPFRQASQAERMHVAVAVAARQSPRLRLIRIDNGEQLDSEGRKSVFRLAERYGCQVVMTAVSDGELSVEIVEG